MDRPTTAKPRRCQAEEQPPAHVGRRFWRVLLTGIPYAVFKTGAGMAAWQDVHPAVGVAFMLWGLTDLALNLLFLAAPRRFSYCLLSNVGLMWECRRGPAGAESVLLALDTLLSFTIVATMIGFGRIATLPGAVMTLWEMSVIANVLGVGVERLHTSIVTARTRRSAEFPA